MTFSRLNGRSGIAAALLLALPLAAAAQAPAQGAAPEPAPRPECRGRMHDGMGMGQMDDSPMQGHHGGREHGPMGGWQHGHGDGEFLAGLKLTEAQQDRMFTLRQATEAAMRERMKAVRRTADALRQASAADRFDAGAAKKLADEHGQALAAVAYLHAETHAKMLAILTPEQRQQAEQARQRMAERCHGGPDEP